MTEQNALVSGAERFLGVSMEAPQENLSPVYNPGTDEFSDPEKLKRRARSTVAARNLFATDISRLDDDAVKGLYQATAKAIFDIEDEDGTVAFGKKAGDPRTNVDLLRRFCKGEYSLIHDPEYEAYQKLDEEGKFRYALEHETSRNKFKSSVSGERGAGLAENLAAGSQYSGIGLPPGAMAAARRMTGNQKLEEDAQAVLAESARRSNYDTLTPEEQAAYRADVIADYDTKLSKRQVLATYLAMREGLSDRASMLLAKAYNTGDVDIGEMESLKPEERDRAYTALSIMRGDQKKGRILGIETDFTDDTAWNRVQLGLYGFQSSVLSLVGDTYEFGKSAVKWTYAKTMLDGEERKKYIDLWDAETRAERALEQGLPDASSPIGEGFQSLMENIHWFIPYGLIGKGGKLMRASAGVAEDAAWYKKLAVTFTPWKFGANEKMLVEIQKAGKTVAEANRAKTLADLTLLDTITGPGRWTEGNVLLARQAATIEHYTKALQEAEKAVTAAKVSGSAGLGMYAAGEASAFSTFANECITTCDAAGISREDSVPMAAAIGWINAKIEHIYVPGLESGLTKSEVKSLMFTSLLDAMRTDGMAGARKWIGNRVSYGIREGVKVAASEGAVEEPLQQIVIEHGKALAATSQKLRENGQGTLADELDAYWKTIRSTAATDLKTYLDTAVDMIPSSVGFGLTTIGNQTRRQHLANARIRHANRVKYQKAVAEAEKNGQPIPAMPTMLEEGEGGMMRFNADAVDYDVGVADIVARAVGVQNAVRQHWDGTDASAESGKYAADPNGMLKAITAARTAWNEDSGDVVAKISDAAAVDHKTAELLADYFTAEAHAALGSPNVRSFVAHDLSAVDFSEETLKKVLPGYVDGSFVHDESQGLYAGKVTMPNGETKTIAYVYGDISEKLMKIADEQSKIGSELGKSHDARVRSGTENGKLWDEMSDADRYTYALKCTNALSTGSGSFVVTDKDGKEIIVNADDVIYLSNGQFGNVGYSSVANMGTVRHETWHSIWRFLSSEFSDAEKQDLAKKLGVDVTKDGWEVDLDETMAYQFGQYASGNYVNHNVDGVVARFVDSASGKMIRQLAKIGIGEEMKNPSTGKAFTLADFFDAVQRGEIGTGRLGYVQTEAPAAAIPTAEPRRQTDEIPVEVKPEETADVETAAAKEAEKREPEAAPEPTVEYTIENPADASVPNARFYRVTAGDGVTLVGELVVSDASQLKTSYKGNLSDPKLQNRGETDEGNALVKKIAGKPDPLQVGTVQPRANNGFVWTTPSRDVFIGNTRSTGITEAYAQGNGEAVETHMRSEAAKRGIEIPDDVKNPVVHFVLRKIESDDAKTDIYDVVRMTNESVNRGMNKYEQAKNDADVLINNNIVPGIVINPEGNIDTSKSADAIGAFRQLTGAQGLIDKNTDLLSEEGETRLKNAILASLLKNTNEDLLAKIISQSKHLDMENEKDAIIRLASEILRLSATKPQYDLRAPLSEALEYYVEWRDKDERLRAEAGKDRRTWTEKTSDGKRKRGLTWETHMGQRDMFRTPSPEARIMGDLFAASRELRSFDKEDNESSAGKNRAQKLIGDYLSDYIRNADAVNTETNDLFGTPPATKLELLESKRGTRFSTIKPTIRFSTVYLGGADLTKTDNAKYFKTYISNIQPAEMPNKIPDGSPKKVLEWYLENMVGKKYEFDIPGIGRRLFAPKAGHIGRLVSKGDEKGKITKQYEGNWIDAVLRGEIADKDVKGWDSERARSLPIIDSILTSFDAAIYDTSGLYPAVVFVKKFKREDGKSNTLIMRLIEDSHSIGPVTAHLKDITMRWLMNKKRLVVNEDGQLYSMGKDNSASNAHLPTADAENQSAGSEGIIAKTDKNSQRVVRASTVKPEDAKNFNNWFGKSKVVDENGDPMIVYRGASFNPMKQPDGKGVIKPMAYFSTDPSYARRYGDVEAYYLKIENPFDIRNPECEADFKKIYPNIRLARGDSGALDWAEASTVDDEFLEENFPGKYDGIIFDEQKDWTTEGNTAKWRGLSYAPLFGGNQIKSATGNNGLYSSNPDVRFSTIQLPSGQPCVIVDRQEEIEKINLKDPNSLYNYLMDHVGDALDTRFFIGKDLPGEYVYSQTSKGYNARTAKAKAKLATSLDEAVMASGKVSVEPAKHKKREGNVYYKAPFSFAIRSGFGNAFSGYNAKIIFYTKKGDKLLYDVVEIEDAPNIGADVAKISPTRTTISGASRGMPVVSGATAGSIAKSGTTGQIRPSTVRPQTLGSAYPRLDRLPDEQLIAAAIASKMAFGKNGKLKNRMVNVNEVQRYIKALHPNLERLELSRKTQEVTRAVKEIGNRMKDDIARGVSESQILQHLPERMRDVFEGEMTGHAIKGANVGSYHERAVRAIEERQTKVIENAVAVQSGVETALLENVYGIDFSQTLMALAENPYLKKDGNGNFLPAPGVGSGFDGSNQAQRTMRDEREVSQAIKAAVDEIVTKSKDQLEQEEANRGQSRTTVHRTVDDAVGEMSERDLVVAATKRAGIDLQNPRQLALFITELARRWWVKKNNLALNADAFRDRVALQFLRKTAANIYTKLVREITYSQSRDSATQAISGFENAPTLQGLQREMTYVGQLINAKKIRETQQEMCERLDQLLRERFGATGRFKADREELRRKVSAEMELRARYTRHAMWLTPNAAGEEAQRLRDELDQVAANFETEDHDADHSRVAEENIRKLNILREFGALRYKPLADIESALRYWDNALEGETDAIVRANYERDVRTKKAAEVLARAFHNPKQKYAREGGLLSSLGDYIQGHMAFTHLLRDMMRFASDEDAAQAERIIQYLELEIQKAGTRSTTEQRKHAGALAAAVQQLYGRDFTKVLSEFAKEDERFAPFMGEKDGKRIKPTKGRAIQLMVSLLQVGHQIEVEDPNDPKKTVMQWVGGYHDNIVKHHRETQAAQIAALLSPADLNLVKWIGQWYDANRQELSNECQALFGIGVYAETWNYFPVKMLLDKQGLEKGDAVGWTIFPKALTPRVRNERDFDTSADILQMFMSRMEKAAQWKAHAKLGLELRGIFGRTELQNAVCANHGNKANSLMLGFITDTLSGHGTYDRSSGGVEYYSDMIRGWAALGALGGNVGVMFKQTTSIPAFGFEIGMVNVAKHMASAFTPDGIAAMRKIFDSDERKNRWSTGNTEAVKNALATNKASALKKMLQASMITNKIGDCVPGLVIGQGIYRDALERGMTDENAMAYTWMMIERTQQSSRIENQTSFQRRAKLGRIIYQFLSTQQQYLQYEARAIRKVMANPSLLSKEGRRRWMELGRAAFLNHFVLSSAYFWMGQLYKRWLGQKPPEDELKDWTISCLLGPYGALFCAGFTCTDALNEWIKGPKYGGGSSVPSLSWAGNMLVRDPVKIISAVFDDNKTFDDVLEEAAKFASDANALFRDLRKIYRWRIKDEPQ